MHRFGFGAPTGVELPGEEKGVALPLSNTRAPRWATCRSARASWSRRCRWPRAYAAIANGGILRPPHIVGAVDGRPQPQPAGHRIISSTDRRRAAPHARRRARPGGTASEVSIPGYQLAGKTGTASKIDPETGEYSQSAYVASFIGFAPAADPKLLCAVVVDEPQSGSIYGGSVAAPAFGQIMSFALPYMGIPPEG